MTNLIDELLREYPELSSQKEEIANLISLLEREGRRIPQEPRKDFIHQLHQRLMSSQRPQPSRVQEFLRYFTPKTYALIGGALGILALTPWISSRISPSLSNISPMLQNDREQALTLLPPQSFGSLLGGAMGGSDIGKGGGGLGAAGASMGDAIVSEAVMSANPSAPDAKMIAPDIAPAWTLYRYAYTGDLQSLLTENEGLVYQRNAPEEITISSMQNMLPDAFGSLALPRENAVLASLSFSSKDIWYSIDFSNNQWSAFPNWQNRTTTWRELRKQDIPSDEELIKEALLYAEQQGIDLSSYAEPVLDTTLLTYLRSGNAQYIPDVIDVVFPARIGDAGAYRTWGNAPVGLTMNISLQDLGISAFDAITQTFSASSYALSTSEEDIQAYLERNSSGGFGSLAEAQAQGATLETLALRDPERILLEYTTYTNGQSRTLYIPALRFSYDDPYQTGATSFFNVPLVEEILKDTSGNSGGVMPMLK